MFATTAVKVDAPIVAEVVVLVPDVSRSLLPLQGRIMDRKGLLNLLGAAGLDLLHIAPSLSV